MVNNRRVTPGLFQLASSAASRDIQQQSLRYRHSARLNSAVVFVPQQEAWIIERMGRFHRILGIFVLAFLSDFNVYIYSRSWHKFSDSNC